MAPRLLIAILLLASLAACAERRERQSLSESYEKALDHKDKTSCAAAIPQFEGFARRGRGYEVAQLQLGECLIETGEAAEGAAWILKAANSRLAQAQTEAARVYLDGAGVAADPAEAGKWYLLAARNPLLALSGSRDDFRALEKRLRERLKDADWSAARARADAWKSVDQAVVPGPRR